MSFRRIGLAVALAAAVVLAAGVSSALAGNYTKNIPLRGSGSFTSNAPPAGNDALQWPEFPGTSAEPGATPYYGSIVDRSLSTGVGNSVSVNSGKKAKSNPELGTHFDGLNFPEQRRANGGNQFSVEPPDQALCAANGYELEAVNDVLNVYNSSGVSQLPANNVGGAVDLNTFYGYPAAINRTTGVRGPFVTDPSCLYDAATQRWFVVVLTLDIDPSTGGFVDPFTNHLDIAVSQTSNPTGGWNIYNLDVTGDGSNNPDPSNACPCLGDYPHVGADANGFYITTNAYPWNGFGFNGAQIYAFSKAQLAAGASSVTMQHIDTFGTVNAPSDAGLTQPGFTVWPAQSPGTGSFDPQAAGTEHLLSSNAADEATRPVSGATGPRTSNQLITWALTNTSSLNGTPDLHLSNNILTVNQYGVPPKAKQPGSGTLITDTSTPPAPLGACINNTTTPTIFGVGCWNLLFGSEPAHDEVISKLDANDTRMQQVMYANGKLWGALDTALTVNSQNRAGIEYFIVNPDAGKLVLQGYLGVAGSDVTYPAIGVTPSGRGVMAFTLTGDSDFPSAYYAAIDAKVGVGDVHVIKAGLGVADGFTSYKAFVGDPPRTRWGDYGAAAVVGNSVWVASEYIGQSCTYATYLGAADGDGNYGAPGFGFGRCPGAGFPPAPNMRSRDTLGNWYTHISKLTP